jgi:ferredoxin
VAWDENQEPLAEYLEQFDPEGTQRRVPFLWVVDDDGILQRAIVTRELALASRDRLRGWRVIQELAGYQNVFAERAAAEARDQALAEAGEQTAELEQAHADELERVRSEAARESMERLAAVLISPDGIPAMGAPAARAAQPAPPAESPEAAAAEPAVVEEVVEEEAVSFDEPYIDTPLCTTCNECTNLNAQLFHYNAEKQAYIADPAAGSFAELVKAAELCPAHCIHPGKPRDGDSTATPELIERAAKFN